mgnify:CR=1 FL=1
MYLALFAALAFAGIIGGLLYDIFVYSKIEEEDE